MLRSFLQISFPLPCFHSRAMSLSHSTEASPEERSSVPLPAWVTIGQRLLWWSESQKKHLGVRVARIDEEQCVVIATFEDNPQAWKSVHFSMLGTKGCPLRPYAEASSSSGGPSSSKRQRSRSSTPDALELAMTKTHPKEKKRKEHKDGSVTPDWWSNEQMKRLDDQRAKREQLAAEEKKKEEERKRAEQKRRALVEAERRKVEQAFEKRKAEAEAQRLKEEEEWRQNLLKRRAQEMAEQEENNEEEELALKLEEQRKIREGKKKKKEEREKRRKAQAEAEAEAERQQKEAEEAFQRQVNEAKLMIRQRVALASQNADTMGSVAPYIAGMVNHQLMKAGAFPFSKTPQPIPQQSRGWPQTAQAGLRNGMQGLRPGLPQGAPKGDQGPLTPGTVRYPQKLAAQQPKQVILQASAKPGGVEAKSGSKASQIASNMSYTAVAKPGVKSSPPAIAVKAVAPSMRGETELSLQNSSAGNARGSTDSSRTVAPKSDVEALQLKAKKAMALKALNEWEKRTAEEGRAD